MALSSKRFAHRRWLGRAGETLAVWTLRLSGWSVTGRNLRVRGVEVDLIARRGDIEALVEVKTRLHRRVNSSLEMLLSRAQRGRLELALTARVERSPARFLRLDLLEISLLPYPRVRRHVSLPPLDEGQYFDRPKASLP